MVNGVQNAGSPTVQTCDIAIPFAQMWYAQAVETGYLSTNTLPIVASPLRARDAARVFSPPPTPSRAPSQMYPSCSLSTPTRKVLNTKPFSPHPSQTVSKSRSPAKPSFPLSTNSSSSVIAGPNVSYTHNIFQAPKSLPQEMMDILTDLGCGGGEHVTFITHLYLNVGMDKWFPMMKNHFALDDDVLLLLVRTMKGQ